MPLNKQNYEAIANILAKNQKLYSTMDLSDWTGEREQAFRQGASHALMKIEVDLIKYFKNDNPKFGPIRFRTAIIERSRP